MSAPGPRAPALRWGLERDRRILGLALVIGGGIAVQGANPYVLWLLFAGLVAHTAGWIVLPGDGWRRTVGALASTGTVLALLAGPQALWLVVLTLAGWLLVRERHGLAWLATLVPIASGTVIAANVREYEWMPWTFAAQTAATVAAAWIAAALDRRRRNRSRDQGEQGPLP